MLVPIPSFTVHAHSFLTQKASSSISRSPDLDIACVGVDRRISVHLHTCFIVVLSGKVGDDFMYSGYFCGLGFMVDAVSHSRLLART